MGVDARVANYSYVEGSVGSLKSDMLVDTGIAVTLAVMEFNQSSVVLWNVPISTIWLEAASGTELVVTSACVMKIELGDLTPPSVSRGKQNRIERRGQRGGCLLPKGLDTLMKDTPTSSRIPSGAYLDVDQMPASIRNMFYSYKPFFVEAPAWTSVDQTVLIESSKRMYNAFIFEDVIQFPIHFRYQKPTKGGLIVKVRFYAPDVLLRCLDPKFLDLLNFTGGADDSRLVEAPCMKLRSVNSKNKQRRASAQIPKQERPLVYNLKVITIFIFSSSMRQSIM
ncbi:Phosphatidylinositol-glycan biosynthesis class X protein [Trichinella spiralis]|uniref:Phosphatidylinositol-glycan biosynthesis class X protein n=2 Tax=Trichinella spiralis TaxID=6334 RepID=A0ABR3K814_TRISP